MRAGCYKCASTRVCCVCLCVCCANEIITYVHYERTWNQLSSSVNLPFYHLYFPLSYQRERSRYLLLISWPECKGKGVEHLLNCRNNWRRQEIERDTEKEREREIGEKRQEAAVSGMVELEDGVWAWFLLEQTDALTC